MSAELDSQIRAVADAAFDQTSPVERDRYVGGADSTHRRWWLVAAASVLVFALVGAIAVLDRSDDASTTRTGIDGVTVPADGEPPPTTRTLPPAPGFDVEFSARGVLDEIPVQSDGSVDQLRVVGADLAAVFDLTGVERPPVDDPASSDGEWIDPLFGQTSVAVPVPPLLVTAIGEPEFVAELGFSFLDVDRFAAVDGFVAFDPEVFTSFDALVLRRDLAALDAAAGDDSIIDLGTGADGERNIDERTMARPIGRPLRIGVDSERSMVAVSGRTPAVTSWLSGDGVMMAGDSDLSAAAAVLDTDDDLYSAEFTVAPRNADDESGPAWRGERPESDFPIVEAFTTMAWGRSGTGDTQRTTVVYVFADPDAADASIEPIATLYAADAPVVGDGIDTVADAFDLDAVDVVGRTVIVTGRTGPAGIAAETGLFSGYGPRSSHRSSGSTPRTPDPGATGVPTTSAPLSEDDAVIDSSRLRFPEPLADDTVAFFGDPALSPPQVAPVSSVPASPGDVDSLAAQPDSVQVIVMDEATLVMRGAVVDVSDGVEPTGPTVDVGIDGARYVDADEGAIAVPLGDGFRVVAPAEYFMFGGGGPFIEPRALVDIATAVGDRPIGEIDDLGGFHVTAATIDGERSGLLIVDTVTVTHSPSGEPDGVTTTIVRLEDTPTAQELVSIAHAITRGGIDPATLGDVTFTAGQRTYLELVSPVDLLLVTAPSALDNAIETVQFGPLDELD